MPAVRTSSRKSAGAQKARNTPRRETTGNREAGSNKSAADPAMRLRSGKRYTYIGKQKPLLDSKWTRLESKFNKRAGSVTLRFYRPRYVERLQGKESSSDAAALKEAKIERRDSAVEIKQELDEGEGAGRIPARM